MAKQDKYKCHAAIQATLEIIGGKWKPLILWHLLAKKMRFNELQKSLGKISQKTLANELRSLEKDGLVHREVYRQVPPKVEYWITPDGRSLEKILSAAANWQQAHRLKFKKDQ
ncbi:MAG TPA: helix-turn-helix domain-containing protein [bacterium]|nr:helix-turn-helix domain-containing protein [bacterium]HQQ38639.1 helix-turn-helix domain-containing protein [bacterium]